MSEKNKKSSYIFIIVLIIVIGIALFFVFRNKDNNNNPENSSSNNVARLAADSNILGNNEKLDELNNRIETVLSNSFVTEEEIASYSTNLGSSSEGRLTNIRITCGKLNETIVSAGDTFSFCDVTGPSEAEEGYQEATVFLNGEEIQALGGGNCQVSSTLYNAVLAVSDLEVIERHEHGKHVSYVPEGKDAAVAYGSIDFKFKNNTGDKLKLYFDSDNETLSVKIVKLI